MKIAINKYDTLTTERTRLENEKVRFQPTEREDEFQEKISTVGEDLKSLAQTIKGHAKNLNNYELYCNN